MTTKTIPTRRKRGIATGIAIALAASPAAAAANAGDVARIEALEAHLAAAVEVKDVDAVMRFYVSGPSLLVFDAAPPRQYRGAAAYRKNWQGFFATVMGRPKFTVGDLHVEADCDLAYSRSIDRVSGIDRRGKPFDLTVRVTEVYRKIGDKWLIVHEHSSAPVDLAAGEPDLTSTP